MLVFHAISTKMATYLDKSTKVLKRLENYQFSSIFTIDFLEFTARCPLDTPLFRLQVPNSQSLGASARQVALSKLQPLRREEAGSWQLEVSGSCMKLLYSCCFLALSWHLCVFLAFDVVLCCFAIVSMSWGWISMMLGPFSWLAYLGTYHLNKSS